MSFSDRQLLRRLAFAIAIKLALITAIWWMFIRDVRVHVESDEMAQRVTQASLARPIAGAGSTDTPFPLSPSLVGDTHAQ